MLLDLQNEEQLSQDEQKNDRAWRKDWGRWPAWKQYESDSETVYPGKLTDWERLRVLNAVDYEMGLTGSEVVLPWKL